MSDQSPVTRLDEAGGAEPPAPPTPPAPRGGKRRFLVLFAVLMIVAAALGSGGAYFLNLDLPDVRALEDYRPATITRLLAANGSVIHQFATERRIVIPYSDIPSVLRNAIIAVEDSNFFTHVGVDPAGIARAALTDIMLMRKEEGASTITQQLAKGLFLRPDKTWTRKIREAFLAVHIEKAYTKEEIFTFYCNQSYMGHGYYGVEAASRYYFGERAKDLSLAQAALLAGTIQRPESLTPLRYPDRALTRRGHVLRRMLEEGYIEQAAYDAAMKEPLGVAPPEPAYSAADYFIEQIRRDLDERLGEEALFRSGLTIETGLDPALQAETERALQRGVREIAKRSGFTPPERNLLDEGVEDLEAYTSPEWKRPLVKGAIVHGLVLQVTGAKATVKVGDRVFEIGPEALAWTRREKLGGVLEKGILAPFLVIEKRGGELGLELSVEPIANGAAIAMDPGTGAIRAWVGGLDFSRSQFDRATQARRQPGSSFKPIIYSAALEEGWSLTDVLLDEPTVFLNRQSPDPYQPENYYKDYNGIVTIRHALEHSLNIPTIRLLNMVGYQRTIAQARKMGIESPIQPYPSMGLGASEVTLSELVGAYAALANLGTRVEPRLYERIRAHDGTVLMDERPRAHDALRPEVAYLMTSLLKGVIARGTARRAAGMPAETKTELAGKTGTTDDNTDAWFIGYCPSLVVGVWVGKDEKESLGATETGPRAALPIWMDIMQAYLEGRPGESFAPPPGIERVPVDAATGLRAGVNTGCDPSELLFEEFRRDAGPPPLCSRRAHMRARLPYYLQRYPWLDDETIALTEDDLVRILRESSLEVALVGLNTLLIHSDSAPFEQRFKLVAPDDPSLSDLGGAPSLAGYLGALVAPDHGASLLGLRYPRDLNALDPDVDSRPTVGVDGRTAATIRVRYP